jgi:signal transduction histidine kinase
METNITNSNNESIWDQLIRPRPVIFATLFVIGLILEFYLIYFQNASVAYTHFFYLIIVLAGLWYQKKAIWIAIFFSALYLIGESLPPFSVTLDSIFRVLMFCLTAVIIGGITDRLVVVQGRLSSHLSLLKESHNSLEIANKKLNMLSSITRHDILNLLTGLDGYLTILKKKQPEPELNEYIDKARIVTKRITSLIRFTKEYENLGVNAPAWQDCRTIIDTVERYLSLDRIMIQNDIPKETEVFADQLLDRVFFNLIDNTLRHGGDKTKVIHIYSQESDTNLKIIYEDDGVGISEEEKKHLFTRGFGKHSGLGLFLSREILSISDIAITENGISGKGVRFEILIPPGRYRLRKE